MDEQAKKRFIINTIFLIIWTAIIIILGKFLLGYMLPFVIALAVAALMQKPATAISGLIHIKKGTCAALLSALLYIILAAGLIFGILKTFSFTKNALSSLTGFGNTLTLTFEKLQNVVSRILSDISPELKDAADKMLTTILENIMLKLSNFLSETAAFTVKSAPSFLFNSIVALAATCYIAKDFKQLKTFLKGLLNVKTVKAINKIKSIIKSSVLKIIGGYLVLMVITFFELAIGLLVLGIENWFTFSLIIAFIDVLPVLGVGAVLLPWGIINIILGNRYLGMGLIILYLTITIIRNFAEPKIVGNKTGINPLFILFAMFTGLKLFGVAGLIVLPVTLIVIIKYYKNEMEIESSR